MLFYSSSGVKWQANLEIQENSRMHDFLALVFLSNRKTSSRVASSAVTTTANTNQDRYLYPSPFHFGVGL